MVVQPSPTQCFKNCQDIERFLFNCQQKLPPALRSHWLSLRVTLPDLDPLLAFDQHQQGDQPSFYLENPRQQRAIAAWGSCCQMRAEGKQRFQKIQDFVNHCHENTTLINPRLGSPQGLQIFCSFSFFDQSSHSLFPAASAFLPQWQLSQEAGQTLATCNLPLTHQSDLSRLSQEIWQTLQQLRSQPSTPPHRSGQALPQPVHCDWRDIQQFQENVQQALKAIAANHLQKVVLSHAIDLQAASPFHLTTALAQLRHRYPDCYSFAIGNGQGQYFIGASPERLLSSHQGQLIADALAGSAPRGETPSTDAQLANHLLSSPKERHEHRVVLHFIQQQLQSLGLTLQPVPPIRLLQLSNIQHLWTPIRANLPNSVHPLQILAQLHPTPAVAGVPCEEACHAIREWETLDRQLYAAPLGWVNGQGDSEFIVGIRSALINGDRARLYAGAGIVAGSDPAKELAEIQLKLQALLNTLNSN
ncbi:isochorismate synthase [Phormidium yuhuli AB48]|uniref:isochorismate synthase n=1 Tax=Phormidium yuhuli AB48 TaxID=2940671 RepID=A0ABY5AMR4_9CYAN|nr:isochorismate synthase [Phormidium yuhuli]USR89529.1 isochorismate synthase [Phormidium yuhuli AB48]